MRGRKPKPNVLHLLSGTTRTWHKERDEPQPVGDIGDDAWTLRYL